jgi:hypothetical protein
MLINNILPLEVLNGGFALYIAGNSIWMIDNCVYFVILYKQLWIGASEDLLFQT